MEPLRSSTVMNAIMPPFGIDRLGAHHRADKRHILLIARHAHFSPTSSLMRHVDTSSITGR